MKAVDIYLRAKHDVSNQLQLINGYLELGHYEQAKAAAERWTQRVHEEQQLFRLPWSAFLEAVVNYQTTASRYSWRFEVNSKGDAASDAFVTSQFDRFMSFIATIPAAYKQLIEIELFDEEETIDVHFILSGGDYSDVQGDEAFDWVISDHMITAAFKINR